ncbi:WD repeat-containing protein 53-like [Limulus polyphemus]|uniref:WD repeat-containing protein 53-like n=1 Tax=Limulus polyphemus TaxID=6850 RepID=A0ABM1BUQ6_LIMPO|nr:WD repeat-containing protein 53-like [Limulus polyphemus]
MAESEFCNHNGSVTCVASENTSKLIASGGEDGQVKLWVFDGKLKSLASCVRPAAHIIENKRSPESEDIASLCFGKSDVRHIFVAVGSCVFCYDIRSFQKPTEKFTFNEEEINHISLDDSGEFLATADDSGTVTIISLSEKRVYKLLKRHRNVVYTVQYRPKRRWEVVSGGFDCHLFHWNVLKGKPFCAWDLNCEDYKTDISLASNINPPYVLNVHFSSDGNFLASGQADGSVKIFSSHGKRIKHIESIQAHAAGVSQVHFPLLTTDSRSILLYSSGNDGKLIAWKVISQEKDKFKRADICAVWTSSSSEKTNCITSLSEHLIVADTSPQLKVFTLPP